MAVGLDDISICRVDIDIKAISRVSILSFGPGRYVGLQYYRYSISIFDIDIDITRLLNTQPLLDLTKIAFLQVS